MEYYQNVGTGAKVSSIPLQERISAFTRLNKALSSVSANTTEELYEKMRQENPWFTPESTKLALEGIQYLTQEDKLVQWTSSYSLSPSDSKKIAIIMAGNIPCVGFHDVLSVLIAGHVAYVRPSSKDTVLFNFLMQHLQSVAPDLYERVIIAPDRMKDFDAVIATGSDNTTRHFEYYFSAYPRIIRKNRTSVCFLTGEETPAQLELLGKDVFTYFGLGCRNVSKLFVPENYNFEPLINALTLYKDVLMHHKYANNYDYQKCILLMNQSVHLDTGFLLLSENSGTVSPLAHLYYEYYTSPEHLNGMLEVVKDKTQCIVGIDPPAKIPFGKTQLPEPWDYADDVDTLKFLESLS